MTITLRVVLALLAIMFGFFFYNDFVNETVSIKGNIRSASDEPVRYWVWLFFEGFLAMLFTWFTFFPPKLNR